MNNRLDILLSFICYGVGLLAILIADIYTVQHFSKENIAEWAFIKSVILIVGSICLLGYDQVFVRDTSLIRRFFRQFNFQSLGIISIVGIFLYNIKNYSLFILITLLVSVYLFALISYISASYRAKFDLWKSQFTTNLWRVLLLLSVIICSYKNVNTYFLQSLFISLLVITYWGGIKLLRAKESIIILKDKEAKKLGYSFVLTNITLIFAVYGEQFLINLKDNIEISSHLFTYFSIFTPIALSLNGFIGFYYGPKVRRDDNMTLLKYKKFFFRILIFSFIITIISILFGIIYMKYGLKKSFGDLDYLLILSLSILCIVRGGYISTSVCLGVFGNVSTLRKTAFGMCISTLIYICLVFVILYKSTSYYTAFWISLASVINWTLRFGISNHYTLYNLRIKDRNDVIK